MKNPNSRHLELLRVLKKSQEYLGIESIEQMMQPAVSRRTLLRQLDELIQQGIVSRQGKARATQYRVIHDWIAPKPPAAQIEKSAHFANSYILREEPPDEFETRTSTRFSPEAMALRDIVRQPQALRQPAGYRREFLEAYVPNRTEYLPPTLRQHLHEIGQSEHMAALPPGTYARQVLNQLIIDLSWNSSRLEGATYSLLETDHLISLGMSEDPARLVEAQMILNHKAAIEFLVEEPSSLGFNKYTLLNLHAILTEGLIKNRRSVGALRTIPVGIGGTVYHPCNQPPVIEECFDLILQKADAIRDPLECSFFLMVHLPYLQPFEDGNKRSSRLAANIPLIQKNMAPLSFVGVPVRDYTDAIIGVYELNRIELLREVFAQAYEVSSGRYASIRQEMGEPEALLMRYRAEIKDLVRDVVVRRLNKLAAARFVRSWAVREVTASDRERFIEIVEEELLALTESNSARYRLRPSEFASWWSVWVGKHS